MEHQNFLCVSQAPQTIYESPIARAVVPRTLFGGVESTSKSVYSSDSKLLLSRLGVNIAYYYYLKKNMRHLDLVSTP